MEFKKHLGVEACVDGSQVKWRICATLTQPLTFDVGQEGLITENLMSEEYVGCVCYPSDFLHVCDGHACTFGGAYSN